MSNVSRRDAVDELTSIMREALAYAKLHDLQFMAVIEHRKTSMTLLNIDRSTLPGYMGDVVAGMDDEMISEIKEALFPSKKKDRGPRLKRSFLWGLIKTYK